VKQSEQAVVPLLIKMMSSATFVPMPAQSTFLYAPKRMKIMLSLSTDDKSIREVLMIVHEVEKHGVL